MRLLLAVIAISYFTCNYALDWKVKYDHDYYFTVFNDDFKDVNEAYIKILCKNKAYYYHFSLAEGKELNVDFPEDFYTKNPATEPIKPTDITFQIYVKKALDYTQIIYYDESPNHILQLNNTVSTPENIKNNIKGEVLDAYSWEDKKGDNLVVRATEKYKLDMYLYLYHFRKTEKDSTYTLLRRYIDVKRGCDSINQTNFDLQAIQLTDLDRDTIGELIQPYFLDCEFTSESNFKILLITDTQKHTLKSTYNTKKCSYQYKLSNMIQKKPIYGRYLKEIWRNRTQQ